MPVILKMGFCCVIQLRAMSYEYLDISGFVFCDSSECKLIEFLKWCASFRLFQREQGSNIPSSGSYDHYSINSFVSDEGIPSAASPEPQNGILTLTGMLFSSGSNCHCTGLNYCRGEVYCTRVLNGIDCCGNCGRGFLRYKICLGCVTIVFRNSGCVDCGRLKKIRRPPTVRPRMCRLAACVGGFKAKAPINRGAECNVQQKEEELRRRYIQIL